jgi:predicted transcriptional regulator
MVNREQIRAARAWLGITQQQLAEASLVTQKTIARFETGASVPHDRTIRDLQVALESMGIEFLFDGEIGVGVRFKGSAKLRK